MRSYLLLMMTGACLFCVTPAAANDGLPKRKPGLWEIKMVMGGREAPLRNIHQCTDADTDALMTTSFNGMAGNACDKPKISSSSGIITVDMTCKSGSGATAAQAVITGNFDSAYTITVTGSAATGGQPMTMEAKWIGPCREGQRPGDIIMPGGIKLNVRGIAVGAGAASRQ